MGNESDRRSTGMTLVEILAATLLAGTLLTSLILAQGRLKERSREIRLREQGIQAFDEQLKIWWQSEEIPRHGSGVVGSWQWRAETRSLESPSDWLGDGLIPKVNLERVTIQWRHASWQSRGTTEPQDIEVILLLEPLEIESPSGDRSRNNA